ncbi:desampylase [Halobacteriaceae archaeon GCM10025711]
MVVFARRAYEEVIAHAAEEVPREACGILAGTRDGEEDVRAVYRARNAADAPTVTYEIAPAEQLRLMEAIEDTGREVVGFYHSHPAGPARPSDTDRRLATWEGYPYVVVSLTGRLPGFDAWRWTGEEFEREPVRIRD